MILIYFIILINKYNNKNISIFALNDNSKVF